MSDKEIDEISGTETTGHEWDGIKELNTPLPRWWLWTFYATIVWAIGYTILFPAWPLISGATGGLLGYSSRAELAAQVSVAQQAQSGLVSQIASADVGQIAANPELSRFAQAAGGSLFKVYCTQCHGSGADGSVGYPNLNDDEWIWGGTLDQIMVTVAHGIRSEDDDETHYSEMPVFSDGILDGKQIDAVAGYVASLSGAKSDLPVTEEGATLFADNCAACHGENGGGMVEMGAPPLNNAIWLYKSTPDAIIAQISNPRHGVMPAWQGKLGETAVKELAIYVHGLGGGQ